MTKIFAHRGSSGTHPENTMIAFKEAERVGADGIEIDVHYTKDDQLIVIHDNTVNRTTNGKGRVRDLTLRELLKLDAGAHFSKQFTGEKIPTFEDVLDWIQGTNLLVNIELKYVALDYKNFEEKVLQEIERRRLEERVIISSFNHERLKKIHDLHPKIETGILYMERLFEPWHYANTVGAKAIHPHMDGVDAGLIALSESKGCSVRVFTVNNKEHIGGLIQAGCSGIITDFPERALGVREYVRGQKKK